MRRFAWILFAAMIVANGRCRALTAAEVPAAEFLRYAKLNPQQQSQFLQTWLETRFNRAATVALSDEDRRETARRYGEILRRVATGSRLSSAGLGQVLGEVTAVEQAAIDQLSLRYRVVVYARFRTDRTEYERRMAAWRKVLADWQASPTKATDGELTLRWIEQSLQRMQYDESAVIPSAPVFGAIDPEHLRPADTVAPDLFATPRRRPSAGTVRVPSPHANDTPPLPAATQVPTTSTANQSLDIGLPTVEQPPRLAHRVEKPPLPLIPPPLREVRRDVQAVIAVPAPVVGERNPAEELPRDPVVRVDLQQLAERVQGYNQSLRGLTGALQDEGHWTIDRLADTLTELSDLCERRAQLTLYMDLVSQEERGQTGSLASLDVAVALLGGKIFAAREHLPAEGRQREFHVSALDELSRRLALLAAKRAKD